jgi:hypothetical protein
MKPVRSLRLIRPPAHNEPGVFCITSKKDTHYYVFQEIACEIGGRAFAMHRLGLGQLYHVRVGRPQDCSCECLGFLAHDQCKHIMALQALLAEGKL